MGKKFDVGYALPQDGNSSNIGVPVAGTTLFEDSTTTPTVSPKSSVGTTPQALYVPENALVLWVKADGEIKLGKTSTLDGSSGQGYSRQVADEWIALPCADTEVYYIAASSGTVTIDFYFEALTR